MASSSRANLILLGLVMASFCVNAASAGRVVPAQTNKLAVPDLTKTDVGGLTELLSGALGTITIDLCVDLTKVPLDKVVVLKVLDKVVVLKVLDVVGGAAVLDLVGEALEKLQPLVVQITVADILSLVVGLGGKEKNVALPLDAPNPVLAAVGGAVEVVFALVPAVVKGVDVLQIVNAVGDVVCVITGLV